VIRAPQQPERLPHGYTNLAMLEGGRVIKRYAGPDAALRREAEVTALTALAGRFPVPAMIGQDDSQLTLSFVPGVPGQEILEQRPDDVLVAVGRAGRRVTRARRQRSVRDRRRHGFGAWRFRPAEHGL
jgi:phosphotransferase family enzyme